MKTIIINEIQEYTAGQIAKEELAPLFMAFERKFREYTASRLGEKLKHETPNFNRYNGYLERACHAAETLRKDYDLGIGIARKGLWLSYVFSLYGLQTHDILIVRTDIKNRFSIPLTPLFKKDVLNKKIIVFDNDLVTGNTIERVAQGMHDAGARQTDLLLVYGNTRLTPNYFNEISHSFKHNPKIEGITKAGKIVVNTKNEVPESIINSFSLEKDFNSGKKYLTRLAEILGVKIHEKA